MKEHIILWECLPFWELLWDWSEYTSPCWGFTEAIPTACHTWTWEYVTPFPGRGVQRWLVGLCKSHPCPERTKLIKVLKIVINLTIFKKIAGSFQFCILYFTKINFKPTSDSFQQWLCLSTPFKSMISVEICARTHFNLEQNIFRKLI